MFSAGVDAPCACKYKIKRSHIATFLYLQRGTRETLGLLSKCVPIRNAPNFTYSLASKRLHAALASVPTNGLAFCAGYQ